MITRFLKLAFFLMLSVSAAFGGGSQRRSLSYYFGTDRQKAYLGVSVTDLSRELKDEEKLTLEKGAYVSEVLEKSPAEKAGIKEGDVITALDGKSINNSSDLVKAVGRQKPGSEVKIEVVRKGERMTITAELKRQKQPQAFTYKFKSFPKIPLIKPPKPFEKYNLRWFTQNEYYGLQIQELSKQLAEYFEVPEGKGLLVSEVKSSSEGEKAGFKAGDVITKVGEERVRSVEEFSDELSDTSGILKFEVIRKGKPLSLEMKVENDTEDEESTLQLLMPGDVYGDRVYELDGARDPAMHMLMERLSDLEEEPQGCCEEEEVK